MSAGDRVHRDGGRWGVRTIRPGGRVLWLGQWYRLVDGTTPRAEYEALSHADQVRGGGPRPKYDGSMDGRRGLFYTYGNGHEASKTHVYLHSVVDAEWPGPTCVAGVFVWETFRMESA